MKKTMNLWMLAILTMLIASCDQQDGSLLSTPKGVSFKLDLGQAGTRANEDIRYVVAIYTNDEANPSLVKQVTSQSGNFDVVLPEGDYDCLFWADHGEENYDVANMEAVESKTNGANSEAFFHKAIQLTVGKSAEPTVNATLKRATAQVVLKQNCNLEANTPISVTYNRPMKFNVKTGALVAEAAEETTIDLTNESVIEGTADTPVPIGSFYVLAPTEESSLENVKVTIADQETVYENFPLQANYKTNLTGDFNAGISASFTISLPEPIADEIEVEDISTATFVSNSEDYNLTDLKTLWKGTLAIPLKVNNDIELTSLVQKAWALGNNKGTPATGITSLSGINNSTSTVAAGEMYLYCDGSAFYLLVGPQTTGISGTYYAVENGELAAINDKNLKVNVGISYEVITPKVKDEHIKQVFSYANINYAITSPGDATDIWNYIGKQPTIPVTLDETAGYIFNCDLKTLFDYAPADAEFTITEITTMAASPDNSAAATILKNFTLTDGVFASKNANYNLRQLNFNYKSNAGIILGENGVKVSYSWKADDSQDIVTDDQQFYLQDPVTQPGADQLMYYGQERQPNLKTYGTDNYKLPTTIYFKDINPSYNSISDIPVGATIDLKVALKKNEYWTSGIAWDAVRTTPGDVKDEFVLFKADEETGAIIATEYATKNLGFLAGSDIGKCTITPSFLNNAKVDFSIDNDLILTRTHNTSTEKVINFQVQLRTRFGGQNAWFQLK